MRVMGTPPDIPINRDSTGRMPVPRGGWRLWERMSPGGRRGSWEGLWVGLLGGDFDEGLDGVEVLEGLGGGLDGGGGADGEDGVDFVGAFGPDAAAAAFG